MNACPDLLAALKLRQRAAFEAVVARQQRRAAA
jgi:hypothetical protein